MVRRSKDPAQAALFDITPDKPVKAKRATPEVKYTPMKREPVFVIVGYIKGVEHFHQFTPQSYLDQWMTSSKKSGRYDKLQVLGHDEYWEKWHAGELKLGHA